MPRPRARRVTRQKARRLSQIQSSLHAEVVVCNDKLLDNTFKFEVLEKG